MARKSWIFHDPQTDEDYYLPINPQTDSSSNISKVIKYATSISTYKTSSDEVRVDDAVIQLGPDERRTFNFTGILLTQEQYEKFEEWFSKEYPWELTDDLNRTYLIYPEKFDSKRIRDKKRWKHSYTLTGVILSEIGA